MEKATGTTPLSFLRKHGNSQLIKKKYVESHDHVHPAGTRALTKEKERVYCYYCININYLLLAERCGLCPFGNVEKESSSTLFFICHQGDWVYLISFCTRFQIVSAWLSFSSLLFLGNNHSNIHFKSKNFVIYFSRNISPSSFICSYNCIARTIIIIIFCSKLHYKYD